MVRWQMIKCKIDAQTFGFLIKSPDLS